MKTDGKIMNIFDNSEKIVTNEVPEKLLERMPLVNTHDTCTGYWKITSIEKKMHELTNIGLNMEDVERAIAELEYKKLTDYSMMITPVTQ